MNCPLCSSDTAVIDSRGTRRRRKCKACGHRFSTREVLEGAAFRPKGDAAVEPECASIPGTAVRVRLPARPQAAPVWPVGRQISSRELIQRMREDEEAAGI